MEKKLYRKVIAAIHKSAKPNDSLLARAEFRSIGGQVRLKLFEFSCIAYSELGVKENQKDVENWCDKTLEIDEENIEALIRRAEVYMLKEEYEDAMRDFKKAYELNKTDARVKNPVFIKINFLCLFSRQVKGTIKLKNYIVKPVSRIITRS